MLAIAPISFKNFYAQNYSKKTVSSNNCMSSDFVLPNYPQSLSKLGGRKTLFSASFKGRIADDIEYEDYIKLTPEQKDRIRHKYSNFYKLIKKDELFFPDRGLKDALPLSTDKDMKDFLRVSSAYKKYRKNKIICVGRSPKWFLNTAIWMKDGIEDYSLAAFSSNWYHRDRFGVGPKLYRDEHKQPTEKQANAYKKYMKRIKCDPVSIIKRVQKSGKPVIITDYIHSGSGLTSYLDLMSQFAEEAGVLDDFAKSIKLVTLGSTEYLDDLDYNNYFYLPRVMMPERLKPYENIIEQDYQDMSADVLKSILIDKNTNECRSTYYPPKAWNIYNPMKYRTGMIADERLVEMPRIRDGVVNNYTDAMKDYRNLMNFRILDYLYENNLLKDNHKTR